MKKTGDRPTFTFGGGTLTFEHVKTPGQLMAEVLGEGRHTVVVVTEKSSRLCPSCEQMRRLWDDWGLCMRCQLVTGGE